MASLDDGNDDAIRKLAIKCEELFDPIDAHSSVLNSKSAYLLTDYEQRFAAWAVHMGVFARPSQSLDRRLYGRPDLRDLVIRLLDILQQILARCELVTSTCHLDATIKVFFHAVLFLLLCLIFQQSGLTKRSKIV